MPYLPWVIHLAIWLLTMSNFWVLPWQGGHPLWMAPSTSRRKEPTSTNFLLNPSLHKGRQQWWWEKDRQRVWQCGKMKCAMRRNSPALRERHVIFSHSRSFCKKSSHGNSWLTSMFIRASTEIWLRWASICCSILRHRRCYLTLVGQRKWGQFVGVKSTSFPHPINILNTKSPHIAQPHIYSME